MTMTARYCCRCGLDLEDAASREMGVGPICRKMDNALLARTIPANVDEAIRLCLSVPQGMLPPEALPTFEKVLVALTTNESKDWRDTVKRLEWLISWFPVHRALAIREPLRKIIAALGYIGLAAMASKMAVHSEARVWCANGRLYLEGPRNKYGRVRFRKIPGWQFHQEGVLGPNAKGAWSCPVAQVESFSQTVMTHWPIVKGFEEAVATAKQGAAAGAVPAAPKPAPVTSVTSVDGWLHVKTPFDKSFVDEIKKIDKKDRRWNDILRVWEVRPARRPEVETLLQKFFPGAQAA